jgi:predicted nucleic acid-binding protein
MDFVVDASMAAAWILPDERGQATDAVMDRLNLDVGLAPSLFWHEMRNLLLGAERRGRLPAGGAVAFKLRLRRLVISDVGAGSDWETFRIATKHSLSAYDANYLALAAANGHALATLDRRLAGAASAEGVLVLGPLGTP